MDSYERQCKSNIEAKLHLVIDALDRARDGLDDGRLDTDQWLYAWQQFLRAHLKLSDLMKVLCKVRNRRINRPS